MKSLGEIYWDIDHKCLHSDKIISFSEENMMLFHAAEEYVEELQKHGDRWKSIVLHDIDYLKASSFIRREQKGYSEGAEMFLDFVCQELERYGFKIDDGDISSVKETTQPEIIPEISNNTGEDSGDKVEPKPLTSEEIKEKLKKIDPFVQAKENEVIPYSVYYQRLTNWKIKQGDGVLKEVHVIDGDKCDLPLFESCVSRADISDVIIEGNKMLARLFMYYVSAKFKDSGSYKKAAAKAFGLSENTRLSGISSNYRADFYNMMRDLFPESKPQ